jgi:hypothetical protein
MKKLVISLLAVASLLAVGCDKKEEGAAGSASGKATGTAAAGGGDMPAACKDYISKMEACMSKVPAEGKAAMEGAFKTTKDEWEKMSKDANMKAGLETACKAANDALAQNPMCK